MCSPHRRRTRGAKQVVVATLVSTRMFFVSVLWKFFAAAVTTLLFVMRFVSLNISNCYQVLSIPIEFYENMQTDLRQGRRRNVAEGTRIILGHSIQLNPMTNVFDHDVAGSNASASGSAIVGSVAGTCTDIFNEVGAAKVCRCIIWQLHE